MANLTTSDRVDLLMQCSTAEEMRAVLELSDTVTKSMAQTITGEKTHTANILATNDPDDDNALLPRRMLDERFVSLQIDPSVKPRIAIFDDFINGTTTSGEVGLMGWDYAADAVSYITHDTGMGMFKITTDSVTDNYAAIAHNKINATNLARGESEWLVRNVHSSEHADTNVKIGWGASSGSRNLYFGWDSNSASGNYEIYYNNGTSNVIDTGVAISHPSSDRHAYKVWIGYDFTNAEYNIKVYKQTNYSSATLIVSETVSNFTFSNARPRCEVKTRSGTSRSMVIDRFRANLAFPFYA